MMVRKLTVALATAACLFSSASAQEKPTVAMIGTGTLGGMLGPQIGGLGYPLIYGSREPGREEVRALVARSGANASAATPLAAAMAADIIILAVPRAVLEEVTGGLGDLNGKVIVDVSGGEKRIAEDGYLDLVPDSTSSERLQARHPGARVVRILLPAVFFFLEPDLVGTPPTVPIAGRDPRAKEAVAQMIFDLGLEPWDAGPLRFSRVFDAIALMGLIPLQQGRVEGYDLKLLPSVPWSCIFDAGEFFGFGRPYDIDDLARFPRREPLLSCEEWHQRLEGLLPQ